MAYQKCAKTSGQSGTAALEFVLIAPLFLFILIVSLAFALGFYIQTVMHGAAEEGVQYALHIDRSAYDLSGVTVAPGTFTVDKSDASASCDNPADFSKQVVCLIKKGVAKGMGAGPDRVLEHTQASYSVTGDSCSEGEAKGCAVSVSLSFVFNDSDGRGLLPTKWWSGSPLIGKINASASASFW